MTAAAIHSYYHSPRSIWISKLVFRIFSVVFCIAVIALCAVLDTSFSGAASAVLVPQAVVTFFMGNADIICILRRPGRFGVNPIACIVVELLLVGGYIVGTIAFVYSSTRSYYNSDDYGRLANDLKIAGVTMGGIVLAAHFALFVIACYETDLRYRLQPKAKAKGEAAVAEQGLVLCYNCRQPVNSPMYKEPESPSLDEKSPEAYGRL
ncbi:unnamed protein product [Clonostachys rhizophaga]|uniref:MARVEL domain-containing protein n=1 Tax=Clonostachys rhizophaga TaxID=160324 RepID=A0A9N9YIK5_9HYPO|nr:unnamed protein product [Clonostachys rhizophaga]